jgi:hypothetical protein
MTSTKVIAYVIKVQKRSTLLTDCPLPPLTCADLKTCRHSRRSFIPIYDDKSDCLRHKNSKTFNSFDGAAFVQQNPLSTRPPHLRRPEDLSTSETSFMTTKVIAYVIKVPKRSTLLTARRSFNKTQLVRVLLRRKGIFLS